MVYLFDCCGLHVPLDAGVVLELDLPRRICERGQYWTHLFRGVSIVGIVFLFLPALLNRFGNVVMTLMLMGGSLVTLGLLGLGYGTTLTVASFVIFMTLSPLIYLNIDIFSETLIGNHEGKTDRKSVV